jgi:hypothetical protein
VCSKDPISEACRKNGKMVKICQMGLLKLSFEIIQKKHFPVFAKNFRRPRMKLKFFFANFQILGLSRCQGWVAIPQDVKKSQNHCTLMVSHANSK